MTLWHPVVFDVLPPAEVVSDEASATEQGWVTECVRTGPCIVVAGPGVGKSHSLVVRLHRRCRLDPSARALVLTFTVGAGRILEHRLVGSALEHAAVVVRRTQQEIWGAFSRAHTDAKGRRTLQVASRTRARKLLCNAIFDEGYYLTNLERTVKGALSAIEEASDIPEELADVVTPAVLLRYKRAKSQAGLADNGDVRRWAIEHVDEIVAHWVSQGFTEVYLDEAQDSSPTEIALMAAAARGGLRVCCVLDLRQALYGFRGARPHDLLAVLESLPGAHKHLLAVNRRSAEQVVSTLNAFSTWAFEGESSQAMAALRVGGEPFRAVTCEERATVYEAMGAALGAVAGIPRDHRQDVPKKNRHLRDALGLPAVLAPEQSIGILTATGKEAGDIVRELEAMGYAPVKLVRDKDDVAAHELLHGFLDPLGEHGGPARIYGEGSPICLVLGIIRRQGPFRMDPQSKGHKAFDTLVRDLRRVAYGGPRDHTECFWHLWSMARGSCARWAEGCSPADGPKSRLRALAVQARDCLDEWGTILNECPLPCRHEDHLERLLKLSSTYLLPPGGGGTSHPAISSVRRNAKERDGASKLIESWYDRPDLGQAQRRARQRAESDPVIYVAVVNQVKGDEFDWVLVCALSQHQFPHKGEDNFGERCRWWVAISRARESTSFLGVAGNDWYWPARRPTLDVT